MSKIGKKVKISFLFNVHFLSLSYFRFLLARKRAVRLHSVRRSETVLADSRQRWSGKKEVRIADSSISLAFNDLAFTSFFLTVLTGHGVLAPFESYELAISVHLMKQLQQ
jgi:hypothetical protein